jgi:hypothetical protein
MISTFFAYKWWNWLSEGHLQLEFVNNIQTNYEIALQRQTTNSLSIIMCWYIYILIYRHIYVIKTRYHMLIASRRYRLQYPTSHRNTIGNVFY